MKKIVKIGFFVLTTALACNVLANNYDLDGLTCSGKKNAIQTQLDYAKKANNVYQISGLEKALSDVNTYCTNDDLAKKYQDKIQDKLKDVQEKETELQEAKLKGNPAKIAKQQAKLAEDRAELKAAQDKLESFYKAVKLEK